MEEKISQNGTDDAQDKKSKKVAKHDGGVADLERVTDYAEEKELSSADISNVRIYRCIALTSISFIVLCYCHRCIHFGVFIRCIYFHCTFYFCRQ